MSTRFAPLHCPFFLSRVQNVCWLILCCCECSIWLAHIGRVLIVPNRAIFHSCLALFMTQNFFPFSFAWICWFEIPVRVDGNVWFHTINTCTPNNILKPIAAMNISESVVQRKNCRLSRSTLQILSSKWSQIKLQSLTLSYERRKKCSNFDYRLWI